MSLIRLKYTYYKYTKNYSIFQNFKALYFALNNFTIVEAKRIVNSKWRVVVLLFQINIEFEVIISF
jgi:hypothetical protein